MYVQCPWWPEEGVRSLGTRLKGDVSHHELDPLKEQLVLLTAEPSFLAFYIFCFVILLFVVLAVLDLVLLLLLCICVHYVREYMFYLSVCVGWGNIRHCVCGTQDNLERRTWSHFSLAFLNPIGQWKAWEPVICHNEIVK